MAKKTEPWGETTAAIIAGVFVLLLDKVVLLDKLTEHVPGLVRIFFGALMIWAAVLGRRYYVILGERTNATAQKSANAMTRCARGRPKAACRRSSTTGG
jgi:hypothetical protein